MTTIPEGAIPRDPQLDSSLAFKAEGYRFIGERCRRFGSDIFKARLLGKRFHCVRGEDAARMFYEPGRFTRNSALPSSALKLLHYKNSVATLDAAAHRHRKAVFMSLMTPARLRVMARLAADELRAAAEGWQARGRVGLHRGFRAVLCRAVCAWAGVPLDGRRAHILTRQIGAMIDNAGTIGPANWAARVRRRGAEGFLQRVVEVVRAGRLTPPGDSAAYVIAFHRDEDGVLLTPEIVAVELLNILRPTVAIARFMTFAALALHRHPEHRTRLAADDAFLQAFVQEARRTAPFFPIIAGAARVPFAWQGTQFREGDWFILDLYGTNHDTRLWDGPEAFRPERFLRWPGNPFTMIPQGGDDHLADHRCAGEWLTIAVMQAMLRVLARDIGYVVVPQNLSVNLSAFPALPRSGFIIQVHGAAA